MKKTFLILLLSQSWWLCAQSYQVNHWYTLTAGPGITGEMGYNVGAEAHLALNNKAFTLGYRFHNYADYRFGTRAHDIYLGTGFHFPVSDRFNMDFRLGPAVSIITDGFLMDGTGGMEPDYQIIPIFLPMLQSSFKLHKGWAFNTSLALNLPVGVFTENWLQLSLGLRFGTWPGRSILPPDKRKTSPKRKNIKQDFYFNILAGAHRYGPGSGFEFGIVTGNWLLKLGYFDQQRNTSTYELDGVYLGTGIEFTPLKSERLKAHLLAGLGNAWIEETITLNNPPLNYEFTANTDSFMMVGHAGVSYQIFSWLLATAQYTPMVYDLDAAADHLWQGGLQLRF